MRDKLAEIIRNARMNASPLSQAGYAEADSLIVNGVILPPCKVGDIVYCDICNKGKGYLDECIIKSIEFNSDWKEPLFTAICYERAEYQTYWASDFGKTIFLEPKFNDKKPPRKH